MKEICGNYVEGMKLADIHLHTKESKDVKGDFGMEPHEAVELALATGLQLIAITDHHTIRELKKHKHMQRIIDTLLK